MFEYVPYNNEEVSGVGVDFVPGDVVPLTDGEYSDFRIYTLVKILKPFNSKALLDEVWSGEKAEWRNNQPVQILFNFLIDNGYAEAIPVVKVLQSGDMLNGKAEVARKTSFGVVLDEITE